MWRRKKNEISYRKLSKKYHTISTDDIISLINSDKQIHNVILPKINNDLGNSINTNDPKINLVSANDKDSLFEGDNETMKNSKSLASIMKQKASIKKSVKNPTLIKKAVKRPVIPGYVKFALELYTQDMSIGQVADKYQKTDKQITDSISSYIRKKLPTLWKQIHSRLHGGKSLNHIPMYIKIAADICVYGFSVEDIMKQYNLTKKQVYDYRRRINKNLPSLGKYIV